MGSGWSCRGSIREHSRENLEHESSQIEKLSPDAIQGSIGGQLLHAAIEPMTPDTATIAVSLLDVDAFMDKRHRPLTTRVFN